MNRREFLATTVVGAVLASRIRSPNNAEPPAGFEPFDWIDLPNPIMDYVHLDANRVWLKCEDGVYMGHHLGRDIRLDPRLPCRIWAKTNRDERARVELVQRY